MAATEYTFTDRVPTATEHRALAEAVGWGHAFAWEAMASSLAASPAGVVVHRGNELVGMGRLVGDGAFYHYVQDVAVRPEHQGHGVGDEVLRRLVLQADALAPPKGFVGLFAAGRSVPFYARHGFAVHPGMTGMFRVVPGGEVGDGGGG